MILITGATGMLGSHLAYSLLQTDHKIRAIRREKSKIENVLKTFELFTPNAKLLFEKIEWVEADIMDYNSIYEALADVEQVYHCAAIVSFDPKKRQTIIDNNTEGTANVVNASLDRNVKKLCHISSIAALGQTNNNIITEKSERSPELRYTGYQQSKYKSELEVWRAAEEGLNVVILNPSIILGISPNIKEGSTSLFYNVEKGLKFYTKGITGYVDVSDVVNIAIELMNKNISKQRFIINSENLSYQNVLNCIADNLNKKRPKYNANSFILNIAWRVEKIKCFFTQKAPLITKDIVNSAKSVDNYSNKKIIETTNYKFMSIEKSIKKNAVFYNKIK